MEVAAPLKQTGPGPPLPPLPLPRRRLLAAGPGSMLTPKASAAYLNACFRVSLTCETITCMEEKQKKDPKKFGEDKNLWDVSLPQHYQGNSKVY